VRRGRALVRAGARSTDLFLVERGSVEGATPGSAVGEEGGSRGAVVGDAAALLAGRPQPRAAVARTALRAFRIAKDDLAWFLDKNPGVKVRVQPWNAKETRSTTAHSLLQLLENYL